MGWSLNDLPEGRPALSRWHPDCKSGRPAELRRRGTQVSRVLGATEARSRIGIGSVTLT